MVRPIRRWRQRLVAVVAQASAPFFEICSALTFVAACTLALIRDMHSEGFSQFVTSWLLRLLPAGAVAR
jgi:hypothetical protein